MCNSTPNVLPDMFSVLKKFLLEWWRTMTVYIFPGANSESPQVHPNELWSEQFSYFLKYF